IEMAISIGNTVTTNVCKSFNLLCIFSVPLGELINTNNLFDSNFLKNNNIYPTISSSGETPISDDFIQAKPCFPLST
ncbi:TPA: hypothetical protein ACGHOQ_004567, partial [Salmonella enterica subsp. diarizonae serovar 61:l,v:z35]